MTVHERIIDQRCRWRFFSYEGREWINDDDSELTDEELWAIVGPDVVLKFKLEMLDRAPDILLKGTPSDLEAYQDLMDQFEMKDWKLRIGPRVRMSSKLGQLSDYWLA